VYGEWPYPAYPPYYFYFPAPGYLAAGMVATGIAFGAGYAVARWATGGYLWGGGVNWGGNNLVENRPVNVSNVGTTWNRAARVEQRQEREARRNERQAGRVSSGPGVKPDAVNVRPDEVSGRPGAGLRALPSAI
jgi:Protein of unknown function (DUF3300)